MSDDVVSTASRSVRRERALRDARQRLRRLEIEAHRIKAELARLESENEIELADELLAEYRIEGVETPWSGSPIASSTATEQSIHSSPISTTATVPKASGRVDLSSSRSHAPRPKAEQVKDRRASSTAQVFAKPAVKGNDASPRTAAKKRRKISPAWTMSLGAHAAVLLLLAPMTFVILSHERLPLFASMFETPTAEFDEVGMAPVELVSFEEFEMPSDAVETTTAALAETMETDFTPLDSEPGGETASNPGQLNSLPTDVGTLMAGGGGGASGPLGGGRRGAGGDEARLGMTSFFGSQAKANRVVFLVDNSGSMKQGRMETTLLELARSVESLTEKQEFYIVFYSDQAYPMFYPNSVMEPLPATRENKDRLFAWLHTVELCSGGALLKAIAIAESLQPHAVYVLSDGDITSSNTLAKLTAANARTFSIHTLGMGVAKPQDAQNLMAIAQANRGTFQMVRPLPAAVQMAKARPIRSNSFGVSWGEAALNQFPQLQPLVR